ALAQLVEQPRVLNGDDRLAGEVGDQFDLLFGEGTHLLSQDINRADQLVLLEHRNGKHASIARDLDRVEDKRVALDVGLRRPNICHMCCPLGGSDTTEWHVRWWPNERLTCERLDIRWRGIVRGHGTKGVRVTQEQRTELGLANAYRVLKDGVKHWHQFAARTTDDVKHLGGGGLLLERFAQLAAAGLHLVEQPELLDANQRLVRQ